jgi:ATP-binding cassette, subfamily B, bacterial
VKGFGREEYEENRFVEHSRKTVWGQVRLTMLEGRFNFIVGMILAGGTATALFIGVRHVQSGVLTLGGLLIIMAYLAQLYEPLKTIGRKVASIQSHLASAERAFALLDEAPDVPEQPHAKPLSRASGRVVFQNVSFAYGTGHQALRDISFSVEPGTCLGIAGRTGAGKTTLISLLMRFYDPNSGQILLDGVDLRDYKLDDLRNQFTIVLQDSILFATSIAENIAYARPDATEAEIIAAARAANAHDFILRLPEGYETPVGERGMLLSGGERQRIAIARAFLKNAPILILDEPTSAIDTDTEAAIMEAMTRLMSSRTTFLITHRPGTLTNCDLIISIENGELLSVTGKDGRSSGRGSEERADVIQTKDHR